MEGTLQVAGCLFPHERESLRWQGVVRLGYTSDTPCTCHVFDPRHLVPVEAPEVDAVVAKAPAEAQGTRQRLRLLQALLVGVGGKTWFEGSVFRGSYMNLGGTRMMAGVEWDEDDDGNDLES